MSVERVAGARPAWSGGARIAGVDDVRRVLAEVNASGVRHSRTAAMAQPVQTAAEAALAEPDISRVLPVVPELAELLPWPGLRRGATVAAVGSTSLLMALISGAMTEGAWAAVVGMPSFGVLAGAECGIPLDRLALVPEPGPDWAAVVSALVDGVDVVAVATPAGVSESTTRALMNRARQRGCVLIPTTAWHSGDLVIEMVERRWAGLGDGRGRLRRQDVTLRAVGRGRAARPRVATTSFPPPSILGHAGGEDEQLVPRATRLTDAGPAVDPPSRVAAAEPEDAPADSPWHGLQVNRAPADPWRDLVQRLPRRPAAR